MIGSSSVTPRAVDQLGSALGEKGALGVVAGAGDRGVVRVLRLRGAAEAPEQVGPDRVSRAAGGQVEVVDGGQCGRRTLDFGEGNRPVAGPR